MTVARYQDYVEGIGQDVFRQYEKPTICESIKLAKEFADTEYGRELIKIKYNEVRIKKPAVGSCIIFSLFFAQAYGLCAFPIIIGAGLLYDTKRTVDKTIVKVILSDKYRVWKCKRFQADKKVEEVFKSFLRDDKVLRNYLDCHNEELPEICVKGPDGYLYDKNPMIKHIQTKPKNQMAGVGVDFTENELVYDLDSSLVILKRIKVLVEEELNRGDLQQDHITIIKDGLLIYKRSLDDNHYSYLKTMIERSSEKCDALARKEIDLGAGVWETNDKYEKIHLEERKKINEYFEPCKVFIKIQ